MNMVQILWNMLYLNLHFKQHNNYLNRLVWELKPTPGLIPGRVFSKPWTVLQYFFHNFTRQECIKRYRNIIFSYIMAKEPTLSYCYIDKKSKQLVRPVVMFTAFSSLSLWYIFLSSVLIPIISLTFGWTGIFGIINWLKWFSPLMAEICSILCDVLAEIQ